MKAILPALAIGGLLGLASFGASAADGTITINGSITDTTCSINGGEASKKIVLQPMTASSLSTMGATAGTSIPTDLAFTLTGCTGGATKAIANFENDTTVDPVSGNLKNTGGTAKNVQIQLLNAGMNPINITTNSNNKLADDGVAITGGDATLQYFARYFATGKAEAGSVNTSVQYTIQYQ
ncbi:fimbrial protein [Paraburkholderia phytofirmans OLGA172]|uniref:Fimbrial protein n=1 Tax=Paraburkholderia phytofirmans OLGA172 TaxID=1417228 RepID=A0A160FQM0_9BURK|nr:fimbrial protein [Paraburkholderia phytofirmans]ANB75051.1 fimbrial protein [Paraburkholderia phytofirmans OLGA172]